MIATIPTGDGRTFAACTDCPKTYGPGPKAEADDWAANHTCKETS